MTQDKLVKPGLILFLDGFVLSLGGWLFWIIISKLTTAVEVGYATTIVSLVSLVSGIAVAGLEYPLLRETESKRTSVFGTLLLFESILHAALLPLVLFIGMAMYGDYSSNYLYLGLVLMLVSGIGFVSRHAALGILESRFVFVFDILGTVARLAVGILLVLFGTGGIGILSAAVAYQATLAVALSIFCYKKLGFKIGSLPYAKSLLRLALSNFPARVSRIVILNLSVVLLALIGTPPGSIGIFFIQLMISVVVSILPVSLATIAIPASRIDKSELSFESNRIGLSLISPIVAGLTTAPAFVLSLINESYAREPISLIFLSLAIIPFIIMTNAVTKLNNAHKLRQLEILGFIQLGTFLLAFWILAPIYAITGGALAVLVALAASAIPSVKWLGREHVRYILTSIFSVAVGWLVGWLTIHVTNIEVLGLVSSIGSALTILFYTRSISPKEIWGILTARQQLAKSN